MVYVRGVKYLKLECVGQGGTCKVYKVLCPKRKTFALKRIRLDGREKETVAGFMVGHVHTHTHTGARAKAWCLLIHADASLSLSLAHTHRHTRNKSPSLDAFDKLNVCV